MVWNGVPEIICQGSPFAMGLAHGQAAKDRIKHSIALYTTLYGETAQIDWAEACRRSEAFNSTIKSLAPHLYEEMKGIAQGAEVDFEDILTLNVRSEIALTNYSDGCTSIAKVSVEDDTGNGEDTVLVAQNWDWVEEAGDATVFLDIRPTGKPRIQIMGEAGIVGKFGMNEKGVAVCMNAIKCGAMDRGKLPVHIAIRKVLESASFDEAKNMLDTLGLASTVNFMIADRSGNFGTIECSPKGNTLISSVEGEKTVWHTNHLYAPNGPMGLKDFPSANSFSRLERIKELSASKLGSVQGIREWLSDEVGSPTSICRSRPPNAVGMERMVTLATIITDLVKLEMHVTFGKPSLTPPIKTVTFG